MPAWWAAKLAGWISIANKIPAFLDKAYENQISWTWHIKIPYAYWDKRYPEKDYKNPEERRQKIQEEMDAIEGLKSSGLSNLSITNTKPTTNWSLQQLQTAKSCFR